MSFLKRLFSGNNTAPTIPEDAVVTYATKPIMNMTAEEHQEALSFVGIEKTEDQQTYSQPGFYIAQARVEEKLVGQALYFRKDYTDQGFGVMTWIQHLFVVKDCRKRGIAATLLRSIWGFSDDYAWGLVTDDPYAVKALESATFRKCKPDAVLKHIKAIKLLGADIPTVNQESYNVSKMTTQIQLTDVAGREADAKTDADASVVEVFEKQLGKLKTGHRWLVFTFREQGIREEAYQKHAEEMISFAEKKRKESQTSMNMSEHKWSKETLDEVEFLLQYGENGSLLDLGCGYGRHAIALATKGVSVTSINPSKDHIDEAKRFVEKTLYVDMECEFVCEDPRTYRLEKTFDKVTCLYNPVGFYPDEKDHLELVQTAYEQLKEGGIFILTVLNMELTESLVGDANKGNLQKNPDIIKKLPAWQASAAEPGSFQGKYLAIDTATGTVYRKEQYTDEAGLSTEYIVRSRRYRLEEMKAILVKQGFEIVNASYVAPGKLSAPLKSTDKAAEQICFIAKKKA